jgi:hypothetical protein
MLTKEDLQKIIDQFDEEELKRLGIFGISDNGHGSDESFIRANKEGLELFALRLIESARDIENVLNNSEKNIIPFNYWEDWIDQNSSTIIHYIEPIVEKQKLEPRTESKSTFFDKLMPFGCGLIVIVLLISLIVGLFTITNWLF